MKLGLGIGAFGPPGGARIVELAQEAENLGYDTIWAPEIYGADCFTPLTWIGANTTRINLGTSIMQISARTPASAAMHAVALDYLSNGRLILGIGVSGPQVVEGWYGQPYPKPLARTREWVSIFRKIVSREGPVAFDGKHYQLPMPGGTGLGKPLKAHPAPGAGAHPGLSRRRGPEERRLERGNLRRLDSHVPLPLPHDGPLQGRHAHPQQGFRDRRGRHGDRRRRCAAGAAPDQTERRLYVGGMGAKNFNVHKDHVERMGFGEAADRVQELFFAGRRDEAMAAVPDELCDEIALVGPKERIRERLAAWKESPVTMLNVGTANPETLRFMAEELL